MRITILMLSAFVLGTIAEDFGINSKTPSLFQLQHHIRIEKGQHVAFQGQYLHPQAGIALGVKDQFGKHVIAPFEWPGPLNTKINMKQIVKAHRDDIVAISGSINKDLASDIIRQHKKVPPTHTVYPTTPVHGSLNSFREQSDRGQRLPFD